MTLQPIDIRIDLLPDVITGTDSFGGRYTSAGMSRVYEGATSPADKAEICRQRAAEWYALADHFTALAKDA